MNKPTLKALSTFDKRVYVRFIKYLSQKYKIVQCCQSTTCNVPYLILRHDVDVSLSSALKMAEIEHNLGIASTYFVLLSSEHYNPFNGRNVKIIRRISELGHEIGLHYDIEQYNRYTKDVINGLKAEIQALEIVVGKKIQSISSHAPKGPNSFLKIEGYVNADNLDLRDIYVHDSQRIWTIKSLSALLNSSPKRVQLLVHPCLWDESRKRKEKLDLVLLDLLLFLNRLRTTVIRVIHSRESCDN